MLQHSRLAQDPFQPIAHPSSRIIPTACGSMPETCLARRCGGRDNGMASAGPTTRQGTITGKAHSMCGICGAAWTDPDRTLAAESLQAMMDRLVHRGPDDAGTYRDHHAALGFRRLSIID